MYSYIHSLVLMFSMNKSRKSKIKNTNANLLKIGQSRKIQNRENYPFTVYQDASRDVL